MGREKVIIGEALLEGEMGREGLKAFQMVDTTHLCRIT